MSRIPIIFEDEHFVAINKPGGMLSQTDPEGNPSVLELLFPRFHKKLHLLTRLDRPVSGCVLLARKSRSAGAMTEQITGHKIEKTYLALVENLPVETSGTIMTQLCKKDQKAYVCEKNKGEPAITHYKLIGKSDRYFLLMLQPVQGRFHQLRAHMAYIGCPIKGDVKYGARRSNKDRSIDLHALRLSFEHPFTLEKLVITAPPKNDPVWNSLETIWAKL